MGIFDIYSFFRKQQEHAYWSKSIVTPIGYAALTIENSLEDVELHGLALAADINKLLQKKQSISSLRAFLGSLDNQGLISLILIIPIEEYVLVAVKGSGSIYIKRNNKWLPVLTSAGVLKGSIQSNDIVFAITHVQKSISQYLSKLSDVSDINVLGQTVEILLDEHKETASGMFIKQVQKEAHMPILKRDNLISLKKRINVIGKSLLNYVGIITSPQQRIKVIAFLLGIGFICSILLGIYRQRNNETYQRLDQAYEQSSQLFSEAVALVDRQPSESKEKLNEAKKIIDSVLETSPPKGKTTRNLQELSQQVTDNLRIVSKVFNVSLTEYFSMSLIRQDRVIDTMTRVGETVFFIDRSSGVLGGLALPTKNADVVSGSSVLTNAINLSGENDALFILTPSEVSKIKAGEKDPQAVPLSYEGIGSKDMVIHYGLNLYILDKVNNQLWRFVGGETEDEYSKPQPYFPEDNLPSLSQITSASIDGSIWFGTNIGKVFKYSQGADDPFVPRGLDDPFGKEIYVYTSELTNFVYVLDPELKRVVVLTKEGLYQAQYVWTEEIAPTEIVVSEQQKRVVVLADQKLFSFTLQ